MKQSFPYYLSFFFFFKTLFWSFTIFALFQNYAPFPLQSVIARKEAIRWTLLFEMPGFPFQSKPSRFQKPWRFKLLFPQPCQGSLRKILISKLFFAKPSRFQKPWRFYYIIANLASILKQIIRSNTLIMLGIIYRSFCKEII